MRAYTTIASAALALAGCATTPVDSQRSGTEATAVTRSAIADASARWAAAVVAKDVGALGQIMTQDFVLSGGDGADPVPRTEWLANLLRMDIASYETRVTDVRQYGQIAVAQVAGSWTMSMDGAVRSKPFLLADFWVFREGRWQVFRRHTIR